MLSLSKYKRKGLCPHTFDKLRLTLLRQSQADPSLHHIKKPLQIGAAFAFIRSLKPLLLLNLESIMEAGTIGVIT